jgi:acyl-CoA synthetase (AMP-forming)/AMP-acid ligase II
VTPMFHANAWCLPYAAALTGCKVVLSADNRPDRLCELFRTERVTASTGVPTVWLTMIEHIEQTGAEFPDLKQIGCGGSAAPAAMIRWFADRGINFMHLWGMTEMSPVGTTGSYPSNWNEMSIDEQIDYKCRQGSSMFGVELRTVDDDGKVIPRDGTSAGRLQTRGAAVVKRYFKHDQDSVDADQWFDTGDVGVLHPDGSLQLTDRAKDVIKSGGEWISSIELENAAIGCDGVAEAAAIGIPHPKWDERPLLVVVRSDDCHVEAETIRQYLAGHVAKWWLPDAIEFVDELPHTGTGKISKKDSRDRFRDYRFAGAEAMVGRD